MKLSFLVVLIVFFFLTFSSVASAPALKFNLGKENQGGGSWGGGILQFDQAPAPAPAPEMHHGSLALAAKRTERPDITRGFRRYRGGWNITDSHYWAAVGFTGSVGFILATLWFVSFGVALVSHHCCGWSMTITNISSKHSIEIRLIVLFFFTCAAVIGCILVCIGQIEFHGEGLRTSNFVVNQSDYTVQTLKHVTEYLPHMITIFHSQQVIYIYVWSGWLLVTITLILFGALLVLSNATSDTCMAMEEWVDHPREKTVLSSILPCVDPRKTNQTSVKSKEAVNYIVLGVNIAIMRYVNIDTSPQGAIWFYNQSGPLMPLICAPLDTEQSDSLCGAQYVSLANATRVWKKYTCTVSPSGLCNNTGRVTPGIYRKLVDPVNVGFLLDSYSTPLLTLQNCNLVRETFRTITSRSCPSLDRFLKMMIAGLGLISVGVMFCVVLWLVYAILAQKKNVIA